MSGATQPTPSSAGLRVGGYRLIAKIGEGGMGVVHLAQAPDGRRVALKVLRPHIIGDDEARSRLTREVASLRRVRSPRIAEVIDADPWGETPYVATRYVPGLSLHEHIKQEGPITGEDLRWFAAGLAEAVIAVHTVGVLHRDIKPSNVLLEGRSPVLIDFGLARVAEDPRLTHTGWLLGTPGYLAPEILYGDDATTASDVHSWAATVVFAATGRPPFGRGPAMAIMDRVRRGEHDLTGVPDALLGLVRRCLAAEPDQRPEMAAALATLRNPEAVRRPAANQPRRDELTMPFALFAAAHDDDATDVLDRTGVLDRTDVLDRAAGPGPDAATDRFSRAAGRGPAAGGPPMTTPLTVPGPSTGRTGWRGQPPENGRPEPFPARTAYLPTPQPDHTRIASPVQPGPPFGPDVYGDRAPEWQPPPAGVAKVQRGGLMLGLLAAVTFGFAAAPYLSVALIAVLALLVRTVSWTTESSQDRRWRRGRRRWYDAPLALASSPWYLVVAAGGTLVLMAWSVALAIVVGVAYLVFRLPLVPGLMVMGAVLGFSLWWGPGSRRLRVPTRGLILRATRRTAIGWIALTALAVLVALIAYFLGASGVDWAPQPGPPWRAGTFLGMLRRWV